MKPLRFLALAAISLALLGGCAVLEEKQRAWIFQPSDRSWGNTGQLAQGMEDVWISFQSKVTQQPVKLHALWHPAEARQGAASHKPELLAPVMLYLHGARWNVEGSANRMRRMQELGFSVLAIDYRGFGKTSNELPSEEMAYEDARAAWDWLKAKYPAHQRFIFGHSLGSAIGIELAAQVDDEHGTIVEGAFTSIPDVFSSFKWGWLPIKALITQRFEAVNKVARIGSPLLVVHGSDDGTIQPELGRKLFEAAREPKAFVLVEGGSHFSTNAVGQQQYRVALAQLFKSEHFSRQ